MIQPGIYDIRLQRRGDYSILLEFKDADEVAINLTAWTVLAQVWNAKRTIKYGDFNVEYVSRPLGKVRLTLGSSITAILPVESEYDVLMVNPNGMKEYYIEGKVIASEGFTTAP